MTVATPIRILLFVLALMLAPGAGTASASGTGEWTVTSTPGGHQATWTSPEPLPLTSARPEILLDGQTLGPATISADGRELSIFVSGSDAPATDRLDVRLSGRLLDEPGTRPETPGGSPWIAPAGALPSLGYDPGRAGPHAIRTSDYTRPSFKYPRLKRKLEMAGHVVGPADPSVAATAPLVLFLHGRHSTCFRSGKRPFMDGGWPCPKGTRPIPSQLGYDYLQRNLASQGFVTVSIAANGINGQDDAAADGGANSRSALIRRHLELWADWVGTGKRRADLNRVVLIGHSRGGEGVNRAAEEIPITARYRVAGQVLLAPTNFARQTAAFIPAVTFLPYCDGDVSDLQGQAYTDTSLGLAAGDSSLKSSLIMFGANHNYFNTEWTPGRAKSPADDDSWTPPRSLCGKRGKTRLTAGEQRRSARSYVAGAVQLMTGVDARPLALFDGSRVLVGPVRKAPVISQSVGGGKLTLVPGRDTALAAQEKVARLCQGYADGSSRGHCARLISPELTPHWPGQFPTGIPTRPALEMQWTGSGRAATLPLKQELDLSGRSSLDLRVIVDPRLKTARLGISLIDADGNRAALVPQQDGRVNAMPSDQGPNQATPGKYLARTLRVPLPGAAGPVDLSRIEAIRLTGETKPACSTRCSARSRIWLLDISARADGPLPAPSADRLPLIRFRGVSRPEGQGDRNRIVEIPFTVSGQVLDPATRFRVSVDGDTGTGKPPRPMTLALTPGQTSGTLRIPYRSNNVADQDRQITVTLFPIRGVIPATSSALIRLRDDDPKPRLQIRTVDRSIRAGQPARWQVRLSEPVSWPAPIDAKFRPAPGLPQLKKRDLPARWYKAHALGISSLPGGTPLSRSELWLSFPEAEVRPRWTRLRLPTRSFTGGAVRGIRLWITVPGLPGRFTPVIRVRPG